MKRGKWTRYQRRSSVNSLLQALPVEGPNVFADFCHPPAKARKEQGFTRAFQNTLAPSVDHKNAHFEVYGQTIPKEDVGGDLVDLVTAGRDLIAYVADVSGHGLPAAVLTGMVKTAVRFGLHLGQELPVLLEALNHVLPSVKEPDRYATLAGLRFDGSNEVEFITAGHVPLLHYRPRHRDIARCSIAQFPVGLFENPGYVSARVPYEAGDVFVLVTDGVVEVSDRLGEQFGFQRLEQILRDLEGRPLSEIFDAALAAVTQHGMQQDDQTLLLVRALSQGRPS
jgi:sigma-B regulation protein RsbU (phosphoserine phosphatase)